jgi:hypothetical protein
MNNAASGIWSSSDASQPLTDSLLSELLKGRLYVNVHTSANPGGEIRGQVVLTSAVGFAVRLDGNQESPAISTMATGTASVVLHPSGSVAYDLTVTGLSPTAAHFHNAPAGVSGGVVKGISISNNSASGTWTSSDASQPLTDQLLRELVKGKLYLNVHTSANPGGEIRGQVGASTTAGPTGVEQVAAGQVPQAFRLEQNFPNPFNPRTSFEFQVPRQTAGGLASSEFVSIKVFDVLGREVATLVNEVRAPGVHRVSWDASALPSGMYLYRMQAGQFNAVMKTILLK